MLSKEEAIKRARRLPTPKPGVVVSIKPIEVGLAWMALHGLCSAKTRFGNPMWRGELLVVTPYPKGTLPPTPPQKDEEQERLLERGVDVNLA